MKFLILFIFFINIGTSWAKFPNCKGDITRHHLVKLSGHTLDELKIILAANNLGIHNLYPKAYRLIAKDLEDQADRGNFVDTETLFWFKKAADINEGSGPASTMIRTYTKISLKMANKRVPNLQRVSNEIAFNVLNDILHKEGVPPLYEVIAHDIKTALKKDNIAELSAWGGSFYYWNIPLLNEQNQFIKDPISSEPDDYLTVGDWILRHPSEKKRFINASVEAITAVSYFDSITDVDGVLESLNGFKRLPDIVKKPIIQGVNAKDQFLGNILSTLVD